MDSQLLDELADVYRDLHAHPELSFAEHRTAALVAERIRSAGFETSEGIGGTGVVGVMERGSGSTVLLRADMDALPVAEATGLPYASTVTATAPDGAEVPVMHACGHDVHTTALLGAAHALAADDDWRGRLILVFQPAEEKGAGAHAMVDDGLIERFGRPDVVLGQHVGPLPAGMLGLRTGPAFAASDALRVTVFGRGGHGSRPETTVDPIVLAAAIVTRLQTIVSRELPATESAVVTVGSIHAGSAPNIIPEEAELSLSVRTFDPAVRDRVLAAISRITRGEAVTAGASREPAVESLHAFPAVVNDADASARVKEAFAPIPGLSVIDPGVVTGSEDVGILAQAAEAPCVYWLLGGADPSLFAEARNVEDAARIAAGLPSNHSPEFAPVIEPTLRIGVTALCTAAKAWLAKPA